MMLSQQCTTTDTIYPYTATTVKPAAGLASPLDYKSISKLQNCPRFLVSLVWVWLHGGHREGSG